MASLQLRSAFTLGRAESAVPLRSFEGHAERAWSRLTRFGFRFAAAWLVLNLFPFPVDCVPYAGWLVIGWRGIVDLATGWFAARVLGLGHLDVSRGASGDRLSDWIRAGLLLVVALGMAVVWSVADRRGTQLRRADRWLRTYVRFGLGYIVLTYGLAKVFNAQFTAPTERLFEPLGEFSPMGLLWAFMGYSRGYTLFSAFAELMGALLLFFRRTATLGALLLVGVLGNVVALNLCYDVPVKLFSSTLLLMAIYVAAQDVPRLFRAMVLGQAVGAQRQPPLIANRRLRLVTTVAWTALMGYASFATARELYQLDQQSTADQASNPFFGTYEVQGFEPLAPRGAGELAPWRRAAGTGDRFGVQFADGSYRRYVVDFEPGATTATLTLRGESGPGESSTFQIARPDGTHVVLQSDSARITLQRERTPRSLLMSRGFHWVNDVPVNR